jgi:hypothetical protein
MIITCAHCGGKAAKPTGEVNRAAKACLKLYCGMGCGNIGRRNPNKPTGDAFRVAKAEYDRRRREKKGDELRLKRKEKYHSDLATCPEKIRAEQKRNRDSRKNEHLEYCRHPEYREWKAKYDKNFRAKKTYGPFADAFLILQDVESEVLSRASRYQLDLEAGKLCKSIKRKREYDKTISG